MIQEVRHISWIIVFLLPLHILLHQISDPKEKSGEFQPAKLFKVLKNENVKGSLGKNCLRDREQRRCHSRTLFENSPEVVQYQTFQPSSTAESLLSLRAKRDGGSERNEQAQPENPSGHYVVKISAAAAFLPPKTQTTATVPMTLRVGSVKFTPQTSFIVMLTQKNNRGFIFSF